MLTLFNNLSIRYKLISTFSLFAVLIGLFVFFFFPYQQEKQILNQAIENSLAISQMTADNLTASLEFEDKVTAQEILDILKENEGFVFVLVKDVDGKPFAAINQDKTLQLDLRENINTPTCQIVDNMTITTLPILPRGIKIGTLVLGLSIENIKAEIDRNTMIALLVSIFLVLIIILSSMIIGDVIAKPIHKAIEVSSKIAQGDFSSWLEDNSKDEIGKLASAFNEMSRKLKVSIGELENSEERYHNLIEFANVGIIYAENYKIAQVNRRAEEIYGYSKGELIGQPPAILTPEKYRKKHQEILDEIIRSGKEKKTISEEEGIRKDGSLVPIEISFTLTQPMKKDIIAVMRDITERKKAERELRETKEFLENVIENSKDGIVIVNEKGYILSCNTAMEQMSEFSKEEMLEKHASILTIEDKEMREKILKKTAELFEKGFAAYESKFKSKDGECIDVECISSMIKNEKGDYIAGLSILRDITERKKMEEQLLQSEKLKSLGELAGGVAHDFNNVLAAILGRAQLLKMSMETPLKKQERRKSVLNLKKGLEIIEKAARDGAETVRRIQEFSRKRTDDKDFTQVNINELINHALEFTRVRWKDNAESKGIKINIQKKLSPLPSTSGSASELREVFTNLINNAIDAIPQGGSIKIKTFKEDSYISIKVEDTGVGIANDRKDRIFDPFFTTKGVQSTGLGLSVSYGIINRHQGTITVDSIEGEGTTFTIKLPISEKIIEKEQVKPMPEEQKKARILVVEDEEEVRDILSAILMKGGHQVETASDGSKGIRLFEKKEFDLVFTDLGMPGMSGWQVAEKIKSINKRVPVALITGWNVELKKSEMRKSGVDLIIYKPFEVNQVLRLVQEGMVLRDRFKAA